MCQLFDLSCKTATSYKKVYLFGAPYFFDVAKNKKMSLTSENGHYKYEKKEG